jgi:cyanophycin synthetase
VTPAAPSEQPPLRILNQVAIPGFQFGLRHASIAIDLSLALPAGNDRPAQIQSLLAEALGKEGYDATPLRWAAGASAAHNWTSIVMYWVLQLQQAARLPVFEPGEIIYASPQGDKTMGIVGCPPWAFNPTSSTIDWLVHLFNLRARDDMAEWLGSLTTVIQAFKPTIPPPMTYQFLKAAHALALPSLHLVEDLFQFGYGARGRRLYLSGTDETSCISASFSNYKELASQILRQFGVPTPAHEMAASEAAAIAAAERIGYPVVVKPSDLDRGIGVATNLATVDEVRAAFVEARKYSPRILVEKHVEGEDHRLVVFRGELISAIRRVPGGVTGDGTSSIGMLVERANADPRRGTSIHKPWRLLSFDEEALTLLQRSGRTPESVPRAGEFVRLRYTGNVSRGGTPVDVLDKVHPDNRRLAQRAAAALRLDVCGVDLIMPDITRSWRETGAAICEVNAGPDLGQVTTAHLYPFILQKVVPRNGRIPVAVILGAGHDSPVASNIVDRLTAAGLTVGRADRTGVSVGRDRVAHGPLPAYEAGRMLLLDQKVEAVVLGVEALDVLRSGLPVERYDVLVLAGPRLDAIDATKPDVRSRLLDNAFHAVVRNCTGPVLRSVEAMMVPRYGPHAAGARAGALDLEGLVDQAAAILVRRAADIDSVTAGDRR